MARTRSAPGGTAASGQPPRESYSHAFCWTTSFPALAAGYASATRAGKWESGTGAGRQRHHAPVRATLGAMAQAWDKTLRARGYRVTPQRQLVLAAVTKLEHATPEEIWADVQQTASGVNISTIYRALELLEQLGLVTHTHLGHGAPSYHLAAEAEHVHLVCSQCGRVTEVSPAAVAPLVTALDERHGFATDVGHLTVFGRCASCRGGPGEDHALGGAAPGAQHRGDA
jgi:Fur family transcriptional regulator, ferric uptake regulator